MADALIVGGEPFRVVVEEGKIYEFARSIKSATPEHFRTPDPISPVTFLTSAVLWMEPENSAWFGITRNFAHILHGEQEFVFHSPPPAAGTELNVVQYFGNVVEKAGRRGGRMTLTEVITKFWTDSPDHPVVVGTAVSIETHPSAGAAGTGVAGVSAPAVSVPAVSGPAVSLPAVSVPAPDVALDPFVDRALTVTDFVKYQGASGDFNAIHHDTEFALRSGLRGPLAIGMLPAGIASAYVTDRFGAEAVRRFRVRWQNQAWPGDVLTYQGFELGDTASDFDLRLTVTRPDGGVHLQAWVELDPSVAKSRRP